MVSKVVIFGNSELAELNHYYLTHDSPYEVVAFSVDQEFLLRDQFCGLPVVPFESIHVHYPPSDYCMSILLGYRDVNRLRAQKYTAAKKRGYRLISYVSTHATTWAGMTVGENSYVYENTVLQAFSRVGHNVVIAPGALISHHSLVDDHCFIAPNAVVLGSAAIGPYAVVGANATITDGTRVARESIIAAGALVTGNTVEGGVYISRSAALQDRRSDDFKGLLTWSRDLQGKAKRLRTRKR